MEALAALLAVAAVGYGVGALFGLVRYFLTGNEEIDEAGKVGASVAVGVTLVYVAVEAARLGLG